MDRENDELREASRKLEHFKEYLPREMYDEIVDIAERGKKIDKAR